MMTEYGLVRAAAANRVCHLFLTAGPEPSRCQVVRVESLFPDFSRNFRSNPSLRLYLDQIFSGALRVA
jgi:hypothetical protein